MTAPPLFSILLSMNILLFEEGEIGADLPRSDRRHLHVRKILKKKAGDEVLAAIVGGKLGKALIERMDEDGSRYAFRPERDPEALAPLTMILGFPRPIQAARIFKDLSSLGLSRVVVCGTELGEKSYAESRFFSEREFRLPLLEGAEQAGTSLIPDVVVARSLARALDAVDSDQEEKWAFDPYRGHDGLGKAGGLSIAPPAITIAVGSERGWTGAELDLLAARGFGFATLGRRILKTETACIAASCMALARLGLM